MNSQIEPYEKYYAIQAGGGIDSWYRGAPVQRGHGIGSFLGGLFRAALPLIKRGAIAVGKQALGCGVNVLDDIDNGIPLNTSLNIRMNDASNNLKRKAKDNLIGFLRGEGYKPRKRRKTTQLKKVTRRRKSITSQSKKKVVRKKSKKNNRQKVKKRVSKKSKKKENRGRRSKYALVPSDIFG